MSIGAEVRGNGAVRVDPACTTRCLSKTWYVPKDAPGLARPCQPELDPPSAAMGGPRAAPRSPKGCPSQQAPKCGEMVAGGGNRSTRPGGRSHKQNPNNLALTPGQVQPILPVDRPGSRIVTAWWRALKDGIAAGSFFFVRARFCQGQVLSDTHLERMIEKYVQASGLDDSRRDEAPATMSARCSKLFEWEASIRRRWTFPGFVLVLR